MIVGLLKTYLLASSAPKERVRQSAFAMPAAPLGRIRSGSRRSVSNTPRKAGTEPTVPVVDNGGILSVGKLPSLNNAKAVTKGEVLAMNLAVRAGIRAADARVVDADGTPVAVIRRFDREKDVRLMYVSARTLMSAKSASDHT